MAEINIEKMAQNIAQKAIQELRDNGIFFGRWIPVSEGLPEESCHCLCCDKDGYMTIGFINKYSKEWCFDDDEVDINVAAWIPLPEPYKAESEAAK